MYTQNQKIENPNNINVFGSKLTKVVSSNPIHGE